MTGIVLIILSLCVVGLGVAVSILARWGVIAKERLDIHEKLLEREKSMTNYLYDIHMKDVYPEEEEEVPMWSDRLGAYVETCRASRHRTKATTIPSFERKDK